MQAPQTITAAGLTMAVPVATFDYSTVVPDIAASLRTSAATIRDTIKRTTHDIIETGRALKGARDRLDHGRFTDWIESEIGISPRTGQVYMSAATLADSKGATVALFPPSTVYRLASKSAPAEVVDAVLARAKSGDMVSDKAVQDMLAEARHQQRQAEATQQRQARESRQPKRKREAREAERQRIQDQQQRDRQAVANAVAAIRARFSAGDVTFIIEQFSVGFGATDVLSALMKGGADATD